MKRVLIVFIMLTCCLIPARGLTQSSANYRVIGANLNSGGSVNLASNTYKNSVTFGQSGPIGESNSTLYQAQIGVQYIYRAQASQVSSNSYILWTK